ncbi:deoxynucleotidyltransferase terminal-interacting protein 2-like [Watersipora subatra]|uniref:deoxynucleotidyltransferase terminal-interacting protein 2-like n=1 Tax=Watersipora subatra TaxID=2589382 RepID=UPI00355C3C65
MVFTRHSARTIVSNQSTGIIFNESSGDKNSRIDDQISHKQSDCTIDQPMENEVVDQSVYVSQSPETTQQSFSVSEIAKPRTLAELEKELFNSDDSSDDEDFSFMRKDKKADKVTEADEAASFMFMIDRSAEGKTQDPSSGATISNQTKIYTDEECCQILEELSKAPSNIKVDEAVLNYSSALVSSTKDLHSEVMKKAAISNDFEKRHSVPTYSQGKKAMARKRREEKMKTKADWFDMKAPEMTEELEADLTVMQMRGSAASWTGYKKNDYKKGPRFFQIATVQDSPVDFYHSRVVKKDRKRTIVDELLADAEFRKSNKKMHMKAVEKLNKRHPNKKGGRYVNKTRR